MAMFMTRGIIAWATAVAALTPAVFNSPEHTADEAPISQRMVALSVRAELTAVLAGTVKWKSNR
jgi:hypothetical protein